MGPFFEDFSYSLTYFLKKRFKLTILLTKLQSVCYIFTVVSLFPYKLYERSCKITAIFGYLISLRCLLDALLLIK